MRFGMLGPVAVWTSAGEPVAVPGLKVRALLADLLLHEGRPVSADRLIDDLWGDDLPGNPAGALSAKVSQLRRVLEDAEPGARELVSHQPAGYLLKAETDAVDFDAWLEAAGRAAAGERAELLGRALGLWRGNAFADFADAPFARAAAARLEERRLAAVEELAELRLALGEHALLAGELGELVAAHPLRERLRAAHILALYRSGRQSEALGSYERLRAVLAEELGLDPSPDLVALHRQVLTQSVAGGPSPGSSLAPSPGSSPDPSPGRTNLPTPLGALIGRDSAVAELRERLAGERLVTLTGPGGVGKTRLAVEAAAGLDEVWFVELAVLDRPGAVDAETRLAEAVMAVLGISEGAQPADRLVEALRGRRTLLVLDNCEHVVEPVAALVARLLAAAPGLRVLATSQEPLGLPGEVVWNVPPLDVAAPDAGLGELAASGAVRLFVARAGAASRGFTLDEENAADVAVLCRRLDGIPLALELAATRVRSLGVRELVRRLDDRFRLLATGHRGAPPRQQTLMAMIDWSWELLGETERSVLRRLAVHADGCTLEAAAAVSGHDVLDPLTRLVDRSLVVMTDDPAGPRYRLLESVAAYSADRLREAGEEELIRHRHLAYYLDLAEQAERRLRGADQREWLGRLDAETANLRAALATAAGPAVPPAPAGESALRLVNALAWYWFLRGRLAEAGRSFAVALAVPDSGEPALRGRALAWDAGIAFLYGDGDDGDRDRRREVALRLHDDPGGRARAAWFLAYAGSDLGDLVAAEELVREALPVFERLDDRWGTAAALTTRAKLAHIRGDLDGLGRDAGRAAALFAEAGDRWGQLEATGWLGALAELTGDHTEAERLHRQGLRWAEELGLWAEVAGRVAWLGWLALQRGDLSVAAETCERGLRLYAEQGNRAGEVFATMGLAFSLRRLGRLDQAEAHLRSVLERSPGTAVEGTPPPYLPMIHCELGFVAERRGDGPEALARHREAFDLGMAFSGGRELSAPLDGMAGALDLLGRHEQAARLLGAASALRAGQSVAPAEQADIDRITAQVRERLGEPRFTLAHRHGAALTPAAARALAG
ncbi:BTAD domain-containing putative transcriptional regulator [Streptosporangium canum]|uniref:BTAD domain-containing putative transcriptional regulator n=1 Tax=Streptosporangium canum TaxID=324952 RepID=UPI0036888758